MNPHVQETLIAHQCREALDLVTFHDMATRQLFETLIAQADHPATEQTATALAEQGLL